MRAGGLRVLSDLTAGTSSLNTSAVLEAVSSGRGFLPPRMTTIQRDAIVSPVEGLLIYNTVTDAINYYDGVQWVAVGLGDFWQIHDNLNGTFVRVAAGPTSPTNSIVGQIGSPTGYTSNQTVLSIDTTQSYLGSLSAETGSDNNGVNISIEAGSADLSSLSSLVGGEIVIVSGEGTTAGGNITIASGYSNVGGTSGGLDISSGDNVGNVSNLSGSVILHSGGAGTSGNLSIYTGTATAASGNLSIYTGSSVTTAGNISITSGDSSANAGGLINISAGNSASGFNGGSATLAAGDSPDQTAGSVFLTPGTSGTATDGSVVVGLSNSGPAILRFSSDPSNGVNIIANPTTVDYTVILPVSAGTVGQFLQYSTGGQLVWATGSGSASYTTTFVNGDLVAGILSITHSLGQRPVNVQIYTDTFALILPDGVVLDTLNSAQIDLTSFVPIAGTWSVIVNP